MFTSDIRYKEGKDLIVPDLLSRPPECQIGKAYQLEDQQTPKYISPEATLAALEEVALQFLSTEAIADAQKSCPDVQAHVRGQMPKNVVVSEVDFNGTRLVCETSDNQNPRPLLPKEHRNTVCVCVCVYFNVFLSKHMLFEL